MSQKGSSDEPKASRAARRKHHSDEQVAVLAPGLAAPAGRVGPFRTHQSFTIISADHLVEKLRWDIADLQRLQRHETLENWRQVVSYRAIDCAFSAWHLAEWFARDIRGWQPRSLARAFLKITDGNVDVAISSRDLEGAAIKLCPDLDICRVIAVASKHYDVENMSRDQIRTACAMSVHNGQPTMDLTVFVDEVANDFVQILLNCLRFWDRLRIAVCLRDVSEKDDGVVE